MARIERLSSISSSGANWVVDGILSGLSLLWGEPGSGKSFVAISLSASIASGRPWLGRKTQHGRVVYIAGEGGSEAVARRMRAALATWGVDPEDEQIPIDVVTPGVDLTRGPVEIMGLMAALEEPVLIVVDTLSRCFSGDENKQEFMGGFVRSLDLIRDAYPSACVLVIHHSNREDEVRGSSVLLGAVDTSWHLTRVENSRQMKPQKLRERDTESAVVQFVMQPVVCRRPDGKVEVDSFGDEQQSLVVKPHPDDLARAKMVSLRGLDLIGSVGEVSYKKWKDSLGWNKAMFDAALSYVLTYPGYWGGIAQASPGIFVLDVEGKVVYSDV